MHTLEEILCFSYKGGPPALMGKCASMGIGLSFIYTLLANHCAAALEGVGLDSYVGFLHRDRAGRRSLALDLMEELRPLLGDWLAITLVSCG